jgi:hypothetical protein
MACPDREKNVSFQNQNQNKMNNYRLHITLSTLFFSIFSNLLFMAFILIRNKNTVETRPSPAENK